MNPEIFTEIRHQLHANPEVSGDEKNTSAYILDTLNKIWPEARIEVLVNFGIIASSQISDYKYHIGVRCELDALPIQEVNDFDHRSQTDGVSHKCGHDGHMTILLRLAHVLKMSEPKNVKVSLIFQPAEENGKGAVGLIDLSETLLRNPLDYIVALHNVPGFPLGQVVLKDGVFTPDVESVKIKLVGKTSHAAEPEKGVNPALCIAKLIQRYQELHKQVNTPEDPCILTISAMKLGKESYGTSAGEGHIGLTLRSWNREKFDALKSEVEKIATEESANHKLKLSFEWFERFHSIDNSPEVNQLIRNSAIKASNQIVEKADPFPWGEDYGVYLSKTKGAMFGLGAGENCPALHNPDYDFPDELIVQGSEIFYGIITSLDQ